MSDAVTEPTGTRPVLQQASGPRYARIAGIGGYRPSRVIDNAEICTWIDSSDEWIRTRTGIRERRWATEEETIEVMAAAAATKALARAGVSADQIDAVIVSTVSYFHNTPSAAARVAHAVGATSAAAFDISAACAGFCYGVAMADSFIRTGTATRVLVIGADRLSDITNRHDRGTAFIFADGAGAAVVTASETPAIGPVVWGSDGELTDTITQTSAFNLAAVDPERREVPTLQMDGRAVFKWAAWTVAKAAEQAIAAAGVTAADIEVFVPHQANMRITDAMLRALALPESVVVARDIETQGNTSAASIPLAVEALMESGQARSGQLALIIGFGSGLVYAGQVVVLP